MHFPSLGPLIVVLLLVLVLFGGRGKISQIMGDFAKGIKSFKKGLADDDNPSADDVSPNHKTIEVETQEAMNGKQTAKSKS